MVIIEDVSYVLCRICTNSIKYLKQAMDVSVIIINYNTRQMTAECIDSVFEKTRGIKFEIILVDNASTDGSKEFFEKDSRITYIYSDENLGFGRANNLGAKVAKGKYLFLLNSDTLLIENSIKVFFNYMEKHNTYVACGGNLIDKQGKNTIIGGNYPTLLSEFSRIGFCLLYHNYYKTKLAIPQTIEYARYQDVAYISGADSFIRRKAFEDINGFDEDFFMYYEETDMYYRMHKKGYKFCLIPNTSIIHLVEGSQGNRGFSIIKFKLQMGSKLLFFKKHYCKVIVTMVRLCIVMCILRSFYKHKLNIFESIWFVLTY